MNSFRDVPEKLEMHIYTSTHEPGDGLKKILAEQKDRPLIVHDVEEEARPWLCSFFTYVPDAAMYMQEDGLIYSSYGMPFFPVCVGCCAPDNAVRVMEMLLNAGFEVVPELIPPLKSCYILPAGMVWSFMQARQVNPKYSVIYTTNREGKLRRFESF